MPSTVRERLLLRWGMALPFSISIPGVRQHQVILIAAEEIGALCQTERAAFRPELPNECGVPFLFMCSVAAVNIGQDQADAAGIGFGQNSVCNRYSLGNVWADSLTPRSSLLGGLSGFDGFHGIGEASNARSSVSAS